MNINSSKPVRVIDPYSPADMAVLVENIGVRKAKMSIALALLGILAGAFISFGAMFYTLTVNGME